MNNRLPIPWSLLAILLFYCVNSFCQSIDRTYIQVVFIKVKPGKYSEYVSLEKEVWKPIHEERLKLGKITGWNLQEVLFPAGSAREYDFVVANLVRGWDKVETMWDGTRELAEKILTPEQLKRMQTTDQVREIIREELWAVEDMLWKVHHEGVPPYKYMKVGYKDIPMGFGKWAEYVGMEKEIARPLHQKKIEEGKMAGWSLEYLMYPYQSNRPGSVVTIDFFDHWKDLEDPNWWDSLKKIHSNVDFDLLRRRVFESQQFHRTELRRLIDFVN